MNDISSTEFGLLGLAFIVIFKLIDRIPQLQRKENRDTFKLMEVLSDGIGKLIPLLEANAFALLEESKTQTAYLKALDESHNSTFARRKDGTFRWHNNAEREKEIQETHENVKEIKALLQAR